MYKLSIAPMLDITDRHCRRFFRLFSPHIRLYTEMIHVGAVLFGDRERLLAYDQEEHPVALQLGGSDPAQLAQAARIGEDFGYDEINLNVGCPSDRVQAGQFGACLMAEPALVGDCVEAMQAAVSVPITVKNRIGIDDQDAHDSLWAFVETVAESGCREFIVHARKAWLKGLSPKENRTVPPLDYELVYALKRAFPELDICINGGIETLSEVETHLSRVDGVMMGRAPIDNPWLLSAVHSLYAEQPAWSSRREVVLAYCQYIEQQLAAGVWLKHMVAPLMGLYKGEPNAKFWRRTLAEQCRGPEAGIDLVLAALDKMDGENNETD